MAVTIHTPARRLRLALVVTCACVAMCAALAPAAERFVDGACLTSGTGIELSCGDTGPFRTITEGILAMRAGDTLSIRGAHAAFDGVYFEALMLRDLAPLPGQSLPCTTDLPCVIQGCRAGTCPDDEQPIVRGMIRHDDWTDEGGGIWSRAMEEDPNPDGLERDLFDPHMVLEGTGPTLVPMAYAGDGITTPGDGEWSYHPATQRIVVNPIDLADPATTVYVPHFGYNVHLQSPTANLTLQYLTFEGTRGRSIDVETLGSNEVTGVVLSHLVQRYVPRYFVIATRRAPGLVIEDSLAEYGCRGFSWARDTNGGCMGYRLFGIDGGIVRRNVIRHLGATGRGKFGGATAWPCPWCAPPWNDPSYTENSAYGLAYQVKQTDTATVEDNQVEDVATGAFSLDVSRRVTVQRNSVHRAATGVGLLNFTPTGGCPTTDPRDFCFNSDHVIRDNVLDEVGYADGTGCAIEIIAGSERHIGSTMLATLYNNVVSRIGFAGVCVHNEGRTPTADLTIANNTFYGARAVLGVDPPSGVVIGDQTDNVAVLNNAFDALTGDGFIVTAAGAQGLSLDGNVLGTIGGCETVWDGTCDPLAAHQLHGGTGLLLFVDVGSVPFDLHLTAGSAAIDAGVDPGVAAGITTDFDGDPRPLRGVWDAGADEFAGPFVTTTTAIDPTTTSTTTATTRTTTTRTTSSTTATSTSVSASTSLPSTTSTSVAGDTTTSTLPPISTPPAVADRLSGQTLLLTVKARRPGARRVRIVSRDRPQLQLGEVGGIPALIADGGSVRIVAVGGDAFAKTYPLPAANWRLIDPRQPARGVLYRDADGPIDEVRFELRKQLVLHGKGAELEQSLERKPKVVEVDLRIGSRAFCLAFGGQHEEFSLRKKLRRTKAKRPAGCPGE